MYSMHEMIHFGAFCDVSGLFTEKQESTSLFSTAKLLLFEDMLAFHGLSDPTPGASW